MTQPLERKLDRLSALLGRFRISARVAATRFEGANLFLLAPESGEGAPEACTLVYHPHGARPETGECEVVVAARVDLGETGAAFALALPGEIRVQLADAPALAAVAVVLIEEVSAPRCGGQTILDRMCEVVVVRLLRHAIERGHASAGLLAGLGDPRIAAALVAIHEAPERGWKLEDLAAEAGMSRTAFAGRFHALLGVTPMAYLQSWRLAVARLEIGRGLPLKAVARRVGFGSSAAFSRAFSRRYGYAPSATTAGRGQLRAAHAEVLQGREKS